MRNTFRPVRVAAYITKYPPPLTNRTQATFQWNYTAMLSFVNEHPVRCECKISVMICDFSVANRAAPLFWSPLFTWHELSSKNIFLYFKMPFLSNPSFCIQALKIVSIL
jgi:hypothetical protein